MKLYASTREHLIGLIDVVTTFSNDIAMSFGMDKWRTVIIVRGKENITSNKVDKFPFKGMKQNSIYKYQQKFIKISVKNEKAGRMHKLSESKLMGKI